MYFSNFKHNLIIIFCILLMMIGCNNQKTKYIIENNNIAEKTKVSKENIETLKINKQFVNKNNLKTKILKRTILENNNTTNVEKKNNGNIVFEFRNERLLQGRNILQKTSIY